MTVSAATNPISSTKGVSGGYIYAAPVGTALPTDITSTLNAAFVNLGKITDDGIVESVDTDSETKNDINGDPMYTTKSSRTEQAVFTLAEMDADVLKALYGPDNVTVATGLITVKHNSKTIPPVSLVLELVLADDRRWRQVIPSATLTELGDLTILSSETAAREATFVFNADESGNTAYDYIEDIPAASE